MTNDLEGPIAVRYPEIEQMKAALGGVGAFASAMSGSGSTVFGLFRERRGAQAAADALSGSGWKVILTESLTRGEYARQCRPVTRRRRGAAPGVEDDSSGTVGAAMGGTVVSQPRDPRPAAGSHLRAKRFGVPGRMPGYRRLMSDRSAAR